jgi:hypothetical protein
VPTEFLSVDASADVGSSDALGRASFAGAPSLAASSVGWDPLSVLLEQAVKRHA